MNILEFMTESVEAFIEPVGDDDGVSAGYRIEIKQLLERQTDPTMALLAVGLKADKRVAELEMQLADSVPKSQIQELKKAYSNLFNDDD